MVGVLYTNFEFDYIVLKIFGYQYKLHPLTLNFQEVEKYKLGNPKAFHYLNQSNCYELVGVSDAHEYLATRRAMDIVGISTQEQVAQLFPYVFYMFGYFN